MRKTRTQLLNVLALENRITPAATLKFLSGNLTVTGDNIPNTVIVSGQTGNASVFVVSGKNVVNEYNANAAATLAKYRVPQYSMGTYNLTGKLTVTGGNSADFLLVNVNDNTSVPGDVSVSAGNSNDDIIVQSENTIGTIPGSITINGGLGADNISIIGLNGQGLVNVQGGGSGFRAGKLNDPAPGDVFRVFASKLASTVLARDTITALDDTFGPSTIGGSLIVTHQTAQPTGGFIVSGTFYPAAFFAQPDPGYSGLVVIDAGSTVNGDLVFSGSSSNDGAYILGTVNGNVTLVGGSGNNDLFIGDSSAVPSGKNPAHLDLPGFVNGNVTQVGSSGNDQILIGTGSNVSGSMNLVTGDGNNTYGLSNAFNVNGAFTLTAGNGDDNVGSFGGTTNGNVNFNLGNGTNTLVWNGTGAGGRFDYQGGGGSDNLTINGGFNAFALRAYLGAGLDTFTYGVGAAVGSAYLDFGVDADADVYNDNGNIVTWNQTIVNYP